MRLMEYGVIDRTKIMVCCICQESIKPKYLGKDKDGEDYYWYEGENPEPIAPYKDENNQRNACCTDCNSKVVLPARMTEITLSQLKKKGKENE